MPKKRSFFFLFVIALVAKSALCYFITMQTICAAPEVGVSNWALSAGDTFSYFEPFLNLKDEGEYYFLNGRQEKVYAGRMPVYGALNYVLHPRLSDADIGTIYVMIHLLLEALAIAMLTRMIIVRFPSNKWMHLLVYLVLLVCTFHTFWTAKLIPESAGLSILVMIMYFSRSSSGRESLTKWAGIGILLILLIGMKPYFGILMVPLAWELFRQFKNTRTRFLRQLMAFLLPLVLFLGAWTYRNWNVTGEIVPLTEPYSGYGLLDSFISFRQFIGAQGESQEPWDKKSIASYYHGLESNYTIDDMYVDDYITRDSLLSIKTYFTSDYENKLASNQLMTEKIDRLTAHFKDKHPFSSVTGFFSRIKIYLFHSGSYYLPIAKSSPCYAPWQWGFKLLQSMLYFGLLIFGFLGMFLWRDWRLWFVPAFLIFFFCGYLKFVELRYFLYIFPSLILGLAAVLAWIEDYTKKRWDNHAMR